MLSRAEKAWAEHEKAARSLSVKESAMKMFAAALALVVAIPASIDVAHARGAMGFHGGGFAASGAYGGGSYGAYRGGGSNVHYGNYRGAYGYRGGYGYPGYRGYAGYHGYGYGRGWYGGCAGWCGGFYVGFPWYG